MNDYLPPNRQNADYVLSLSPEQETSIDTAEECGLKWTGVIDEDGQPEFVGDAKTWEKFNELN